MTALSATLPTCPLPGCKHATDQVGKPCSDCLAAIGTAIHEVPGSTLDPEAFLKAQRENDTAVRVILANRAFATLTPAEEEFAGEILKANQVCWLCEQRRTCRRTDQGWQCRECDE